MVKKCLKCGFTWTIGEKSLARKCPRRDCGSTQLETVIIDTLNEDDIDDELNLVDKWDGDDTQSFS